MASQLIKKKPLEGYQNVYPKTFIDAIKDRESGVSLTDILQGFNMYFLSYYRSAYDTRCQVPLDLRREGLWITYVLYDHTVVVEWYNSDKIDDINWGEDNNWRQASNALVGDLSIASDGCWVINGVKTTFQARGEQGLTPLLRVGNNNKLQVSYSQGKSWEDISDYIVPQFRWRSSTSQEVGAIVVSMDLGKTWTTLSNPFRNNLKISKYIGINDSFPLDVAEGTIVMRGPYYAEDDTLNYNPIYRMYVYSWKDDVLGWQDNGEFTSISAGVVQEEGYSETLLMSQKSVTESIKKVFNKFVVLTEEEYESLENKDEDTFYFCTET